MQGFQLLFATLVVSALDVRHTTPQARFAQPAFGEAGFQVEAKRKKCKRGHYWDKNKKRCVRPSGGRTPRGSF